MSSFNMSNGGGASFGGYDQSKGYGSMAPYQEEYHEPQIYRVREATPTIFGLCTDTY